MLDLAITVLTVLVVFVACGLILLDEPFTVGTAAATDRGAPFFSPTVTFERVGAIWPLERVTGLILSLPVVGATPVLLATSVAPLVAGAVICGVTRVGLLAVMPGVAVWTFFPVTLLSNAGAFAPGRVSDVDDVLAILLASPPVAGVLPVVDATFAVPVFAGAVICGVTRVGLLAVIPGFTV